LTPSATGLTFGLPQHVSSALREWL